MVRRQVTGAEAPSLLWPGGLELREEGVPACFPDLHLDELEGLVLAPQGGWGLEAYFRRPPALEEEVVYRQRVAQELEEPAGAAPLRAYLRAMEKVHALLQLAAKARHPWQKALYHLQGAQAYLEAVEALGRAWGVAPPRSSGLKAYAAYLEAYLRGPGFRELREEARESLEQLSGVRYVLHVHEGRLTVRVHQGEADYGKRVVETFRPFLSPALAHLWEPELPQGPWLNHVEEWLLDHLALLFPEAFAQLRAFHEGHRDFLDPVLGRLQREARFLLAYLDFVAPLRAAGLPFTYPEPAGKPPFFVQEAFDLVLAARLVAEGKRPVPNGFRLDGERILVVTGPNQGGKTTFIRMVGQLHHLFALGLPVPGRKARLAVPDRILTHFEARENPEDLRSKLEADLLRLKGMLDLATERSLLLLNEPLASAALEDARFIGRFLVERIQEKGSLAVLVTFLDELARLPGTKSLVAEVDPQDPARRTFRVVERPADGKAYALALAAKHGLTYEALKERLGRAP